MQYLLGAIASPQILQRSGVGAASLLKSFELHHLRLAYRVTPGARRYGARSVKGCCPVISWAQSSPAPRPMLNRGR
nr:hypothetical protein [Candidatus Pantoea persica]